MSRMGVGSGVEVGVGVGVRVAAPWVVLGVSVGQQRGRSAMSLPTPGLGMARRVAGVKVGGSLRERGGAGVGRQLRVGDWSRLAGVGGEVADRAVCLGTCAGVCGRAGVWARAGAWVVGVDVLLGSTASRLGVGILPEASK